MIALLIAAGYVLGKLAWDWYERNRAESPEHAQGYRYWLAIAASSILAVHACTSTTE